MMPLNKSNAQRRSFQCYQCPFSASVILFLAIFTVLPALAACGSHQPVDQIADALFYDACASPPCWAGIQIGVTSFDEAQAILETRYGVENVTSGDDFIRWQADSIDGLREGYISFVDNLAYDMFLMFDDRSNFTVRRLIEIFGEPTWVEVRGVSTCLGVSLLYPDAGVYAILDTRDDVKGVGESQLVSVLQLMPASLTQNWVVYDAAQVEWAGYQDYCQLVFTAPASAP
jgi:hypothetical protein